MPDNTVIVKRALICKVTQYHFYHCLFNDMRESTISSNIIGLISISLNDNLIKIQLSKNELQHRYGSSFHGMLSPLS